MDFWKSLNGEIHLEITCAEPENTLLQLNRRGIVLFDVEQCSELKSRFRVSRRDLETAETIFAKNGTEWKVLKRVGAYWTFRPLVKRPVLFLGILVFLMLCLYLPSRIFFVEVEGNAVVSAKRIMAAAEECGVKFGASRRNVRSEKVKNSLLSQLPQLKWAGINTKGCVAIISVKEGASVQNPEKKGEFTRMTALRDGYILSATATKGNLLVQPGQTVKAGQTLISGYIDCGICIRATGAEGEVLAQTVREMDSAIPLIRYEQRQIGKLRKKYSLLLGKKRINLWKDSGILDATCGRMYKEYYMTLPGGFRLPVAICVESCCDYYCMATTVDTERLRLTMKSYGEQWILSQMQGGMILESTVSFAEEDNILRFTGRYICREEIGRLRQEQIGDTNGEDS